MAKIREQVDRIRFVLLVLYHVLVTVLVTSVQWVVGKITAVA
ncbi:MAG: hypothetical protein R3C62_07575 [Chloroflexota bacterium]